MSRPKIGDIYSISCECGMYYFQYIENNKIFGQVIKIFDGAIVSQNDINIAKERFKILFPINAAIKCEEVKYVGFFEVFPKYELGVPLKYPNLSLKDNRVVSWTIIQGEKQERVLHLDTQQNAYGFAYAVNISKLQFLICSNWNSSLPYPM